VGPKCRTPSREWIAESVSKNKKCLWKGERSPNKRGPIFLSERERGEITGKLKRIRSNEKELCIEGKRGGGWQTERRDRNLGTAQYGRGKKEELGGRSHLGLKKSGIAWDGNFSTNEGKGCVGGKQPTEPKKGCHVRTKEVSR